MFPAASYCPAAAVPIAPKIPAPMTAPIASMMRSPAPRTRLSDCGVSSSLTRSSAIGFRLKSCRTNCPAFGLRRDLWIDEDAVFVIDWAPVPSLRRTKHKTPHGFHEYAAVARIPDRGTHLNLCHTPVRPNPEPDLVLPFLSGRCPRGDNGHQERRGPENITRAAPPATPGTVGPAPPG